MKAHFYLAALLVAASSTVVAARQPTDEEKKAMGAVIDQCATITGANYLNEKCKQLPADTAKQFAQEPAYCQQALIENMGLAAEFVTKLDQAGKDVAAKTECGDQSKAIIIQSFNRSVGLHKGIAAVKEAQKQNKDSVPMLSSKEAN